jgi:hypothetical protein
MVNLGANTVNGNMGNLRSLGGLRSVYDVCRFCNLTAEPEGCFGPRRKASAAQRSLASRLPRTSIVINPEPFYPERHTDREGVARRRPEGAWFAGLS